jgi:hypothetical protein
VVNQHYKNVINASPAGLPFPTSDQLLKASYSYYNGTGGLGGAGFYYVPTADNKGWQRNPNPTNSKTLADALNYGDDAMSILQSVQNGTPPADWS